MSVETIERCDVCGVNCADVLRDRRETILRHDGYGYIQVKRIKWRFGPWPRFWHREDHGFEIVCDVCLDSIRDAVLAARPPAGEQP